MTAHLSEPLYPARLEAYLQPELLTQAPGRRTLKALAPGGRPVIIKELAVHALDHWKGLELFERELKTLQRLQHPRLPRLLTEFRVSAADEMLYLVLEQLPGQSLEQKLVAGWRPQENEVIEIARQLLEIVRDLHGLRPAVLHRDIKPGNVLLDEGGEVYLVDLGALREGLRTKPGSTLVGSFGYMAPEQGLGQAFASSDLYGIGSTLIHLLAGVSPTVMPCEELKLQFRPYLHCSLPLQHWLTRMVAPWPEQRYASAAIALEALVQLQKYPPWPELPPQLRGSRLQLKQEAHLLTIAVPPGRWTRLVYLWLCFSLFFGWFTLFIGLLLAVSPSTPGSETIGVGAVCLGAILSMTFAFCCWAALGRNLQLQISRSSLQMVKRCWGLRRSERSYPLAQIEGFEMAPLPGDSYQQQALALLHQQNLDFLIPALEPADQLWLQQVLQEVVASQLPAEKLQAFLTPKPQTLSRLADDD